MTDPSGTEPRAAPGTAGRTAGSPGSADRVVDVLELLAREPDLGLTTVAERLGLSKAVVHRILTSLASRALVERGPGGRGHRLGPAFAGAGAGQRVDRELTQAAAPFVDQIAATTTETITVSRLHGDTRIVVAQCRSPHEIYLSVEMGVALPLHAGASGRVMLAHAGEQLRRRVLGGPLQAITGRTCTDPEALAADLAQVAERGYATSDGERQPGAYAIAAPVVDHRDVVIGALAVCGPRERFPQGLVTTTATLVREAAHGVSRTLVSRRG